MERDVFADAANRKMNVGYTDLFNNQVATPVLGVSTTASTTVNSSTVSVSSTSGLAAGQAIYGVGLAYGTLISSVGSGVITISPAATSTQASTTLSIGCLQSDTYHWTAACALNIAQAAVSDMTALDAGGGRNVVQNAVTYQRGSIVSGSQFLNVPYLSTNINVPPGSLGSITGPTSGQLVLGADAYENINRNGTVWNIGLLTGGYGDAFDFHGSGNFGDNGNGFAIRGYGDAVNNNACQLTAEGLAVPIIACLGVDTTHSRATLSASIPFESYYPIDVWASELTIPSGTNPTDAAQYQQISTIGRTGSASDISTGTLADARLSSNVDLLNSNQTITGTKTFGGSANPQFFFAPTSGATTNSQIYQNGNVWYLATSNIGNNIIVDLMTGDTTIRGIATSPSIVPVYNASGTLQTSAHTVIGTGTLVAGQLTVTFTGAAVFTSSSSYVCQTTGNNSGSLLASPVQAQNTSGSVVVFGNDNGTDTDSFGYTCTGN
jgi:hypothetical protein